MTFRRAARHAGFAFFSTVTSSWTCWFGGSPDEESKALQEIGVELSVGPTRDSSLFRLPDHSVNRLEDRRLADEASGRLDGMEQVLRHEETGYERFLPSSTSTRRF